MDDLPKPLPPPGEWHRRGLCRWVKLDGLPVNFFPDVGEDSGLARLVCAACSVREDCLRYALENRVGHGVWGGKSPQERRRLRSMSVQPRRKQPSRLILPAAEACPCCESVEAVVTFTERVWYCLDCRLRWPALGASVG